MCFKLLLKNIVHYGESDEHKKVGHPHTFKMLYLDYISHWTIFESIHYFGHKLFISNSIPIRLNLHLRMSNGAIIKSLIVVKKRGLKSVGLFNY